MAHVQASILEHKGEMRAQASDAKAGRKRLYERMEEMGEQSMKMEGSIASLTTQVGGVKLVTDRWTRWEHMGAGGAVVIGAVMALVGGIIATYWKQIWVKLLGP